jgi:hypothetical protein
MNKPTDQEDDIHYYSSAEIQFAFENQARNHIFQKIEKWFIYSLFGVCFYFALIVLGGDFIAQYQAKDKRNIQTGCLYFIKWKNGVRYYQLEYVSNNKIKQVYSTERYFFGIPSTHHFRKFYGKDRNKDTGKYIKDKGEFCNKIQFVRVNFNPLIDSNIFNKYYVYDVSN